MNVLDLLQQKGISPRRVSSAKGGEYHSSCPGCGDGGKGSESNRFHVWPAQNEGQGSWWCRGCGKGGDGIQFLRDFDGLGFEEACRRLEVDVPKKEQFRTPRVKTGLGKGAGAWQPEAAADPPELWQEKAGKLVAWAHATLLENESARRWLLKRGIDKKSIIRFQLGWNGGDDQGRDLWRPRESWGLPPELKPDGKSKRLWIPKGLVIPLLRPAGRVIRIRIRRPEGEPRYYVLPGSNTDCLVAPGARRLAIVVESELDAVLIERFAGDLATVIGLGNSSRKPDVDADRALRNAVVILLAADFDAGGINALPWWMEHYPRAVHWPVPQAKDPGDAFKSGIDIRTWILAGCPRGWQIDTSLTGVRADSEAPGVSVAAADESRDGIPAGVAELAGLLAGSPVVIFRSDKRVTIREPRSWADRNWEKSREISRLVYMVPEVFAWIEHHPAETINSKNILEVHNERGVSGDSIDDVAAERNESAQEI